VIRQLAGRLTGTAISTVRFATAIPVGVTRSLVERVTHRGSEHGTTSESQPAAPPPRRQQPPQREPQEQAAETATAAKRAGRKKAAPAGARTRAGTPKAGDVRQEDEAPDVVLSVDAPPEQVELPVDVVGQALAAEEAEQAERPKQPQPVHVDEQAEVVYSSSSDQD
jgi:hypothetical protein